MLIPRRLGAVLPSQAQAEEREGQGIGGFSARGEPRKGEEEKEITVEDSASGA